MTHREELNEPLNQTEIREESSSRQNQADEQLKLLKSDQETSTIQETFKLIKGDEENNSKVRKAISNLH